MSAIAGQVRRAGAWPGACRIREHARPGPAWRIGTLCQALGEIPGVSLIPAEERSVMNAFSAASAPQCCTIPPKWQVVAPGPQASTERTTPRAASRSLPDASSSRLVASSAPRSFNHRLSRREHRQLAFRMHAALPCSIRCSPECSNPLHHHSSSIIGERFHLAQHVLVVDLVG